MAPLSLSLSLSLLLVLHTAALSPVLCSNNGSSAVGGEGVVNQPARSSVAGITKSFLAGQVVDVPLPGSLDAPAPFPVARGLSGLAFAGTFFSGRRVAAMAWAMASFIPTAAATCATPATSSPLDPWMVSTILLGALLLADIVWKAAVCWRRRQAAPPVAVEV